MLLVTGPYSSCHIQESQGSLLWPEICASHQGKETHSLKKRNIYWMVLKRLPREYLGAGVPSSVPSPAGEPARLHAGLYLCS